MKKNITINLYGQLYAIDEDAYGLLEQYLDNMKRYFEKRKGGEEIADDIERRVAELFSDLNTSGVEAISIEHVQDIIHRIGNPEEWDDECSAETTEKVNAEAQTNRSGSYNGETPPPPPYKNVQGRVISWFGRRRYYRNPEDKMLGGVLSGLSAYFGGNDPFPWRILFVLLTLFSYSALAFVYLIVWAFTSEARTTEEKLLMRGMPVNPQSINTEMMRENNLGQMSQASSVRRQKKHLFLNTCLIVMVFCFKIIVFLFALLGVITLVILTVILSYIITCAVMGNVEESNIFYEMAYAMSVDRIVMWEYIASMCLGLISSGIFLYGTTRWLFHHKDTTEANRLQVFGLTLACIVSLITSIILCVIAVSRNDAISQECYEKKNSVGGYFMLEDDRKWLNKDGWEVINYSGNSKHRGLYESTENWESEREPWHHFLSFNKADSEKKLIVDFRRKEYLNPGYYHIESITQADSRGATINVMKGDSLICNMDIPKEDHEELGNMASMSYESFMRTAFASPTFTCEQWANHTYEEAKRWSYTRSDTFYSSGGDITMQILSGVKETSPNEFSIYDIKIVADSIP